MVVPVKTLPESNKYYTKLSIGPYKRIPDAFKLAEFDEKYVVHLPLPTELRDDTAVSYNSVPLETVGDFQDKRKNMIDAAMLRNIGGLTQLGVSTTNKLFSNDGAVLKAISGAMAGVVQSLIPAEQVSSAIQQNLGAAPNPNPSVMFQGPLLRDFSFTWAFYPNNEKESIKIDKLIRKLKAMALPSDNIAGSSAILNYPHICQLNFYPWDRGGTGPHGWDPDKSIIRIKKCFMSSVNVNYNAYGGTGFFEGDRNLPISYALTINFKEIEYLLSDDWDRKVAADREVAQVNSKEIAGKGWNLASGIAGQVGVGVFKVAKDLIFDEIPTQREADAEGETKDALGELRPGIGEVVIRTLATSGINSGALNKVTQSADGKFSLVIEDSGRVNRAGVLVKNPPKTLSFNTRVELDAYLDKEKISRGEVQQPPPAT
jgi:hypothetical protein